MLDLPLLLKILQAPACERSVDLEPIDEGSDGNEAVRLDILVKLVGSGLVENDGVLCLVLDYDGEFVSVSAAPAIHVDHVPFPLDHFFFCFFAPDAAGAIVDVCAGGLGR